MTSLMDDPPAPLNNESIEETFFKVPSTQGAWHIRFNFKKSVWIIFRWRVLFHQLLVEVVRVQQVTVEVPTGVGLLFLEVEPQLALLTNLLEMENFLRKSGNMQS